MKRQALLLVLSLAPAGALLVGFAGARPLASQADNVPDPQETAARKAPKKMIAGMEHVPVGTTINARLTKAIDAQHSKPGDEVDAKTNAAVKVGGRLIIPKGATLIGHIAEVKTKSDDEPTSTVLVEFDKALLKPDGEMPLRAGIASIASPQASAAPADDMPGDMGVPAESTSSPSAAPRGGIGGGGGMNGATGSSDHAKRNSTSQEAGETPQKAAASFTLEQRENGSVITCNSWNVHLDSGTQLLLKVLAER